MENNDRGNDINLPQEEVQSFSTMTNKAFSLVATHLVSVGKAGPPKMARVDKVHRGVGGPSGMLPPSNIRLHKV